MRKKLIIFGYTIIFFLITNCGFKVVNQSELINFNIANVEISGDNRISYIIRNKLLPYSKNNEEKLLNLNINVKKDKIIKEKNIKNEITKFEISLVATVEYNLNGARKFQISEAGDYLVSSQYSQTLNNEKKLIKTLSEVLAESMIEELIQKVNDL